MKIEDLEKDDLMDAISAGVKSALMEVVPDRFMKDAFFKAIEEGVRSAIWQVATNASDMPSHDFYDSIKDGVEAAHKKIA